MKSFSLDESTQQVFAGRQGASGSAVTGQGHGASGSAIALAAATMAGCSVAAAGGTSIHPSTGHSTGSTSLTHNYQSVNPCMLMRRRRSSFHNFYHLSLSHEPLCLVTRVTLYMCLPFTYSLTNSLCACSKRSNLTSTEHCFLRMFMCSPSMCFNSHVALVGEMERRSVKCFQSPVCSRVVQCPVDRSNAPVTSTARAMNRQIVMRYLLSHHDSHAIDVSRGASRTSDKISGSNEFSGDTGYQ